MHQAAGVGGSSDETAKRGGSPQPRGEKGLINRLLLKSQQTNADLRVWIVEATAKKPCLMSIHINKITGSGPAGHFGNMAVEHPQMSVIWRRLALRQEANLGCRNGCSLCHGGRQS